jgi:hypothetical protein
MAETHEDRIHERDCHFWVGSGRVAGRDEEFWHRARQVVADDGNQPACSTFGTAPAKAGAIAPATAQTWPPHITASLVWGVSASVGPL